MFRCLGFLFLSCLLHAQEMGPQLDSLFPRRAPSIQADPPPHEPEEKLRLIHSDFTQKSLAKFGGNTFLTGNVELSHKGSTLRADTVVIYDKKNLVKARSNVSLLTDQGNTITCGELEYDANTQNAVARDQVVLTDPEQVLRTNVLYYERAANIAYFNTGGTIEEGDNITYSEVGTYYLDEKRMLLERNYTIDNQEYVVTGDHVNYFRDIQKSVFEGPTFIRSKGHPSEYLYTEQGHYLMGTKEVFLKKGSKIHYNGKILSSDEMYFNQLTGFGRAEHNVKLDDPEEKRYIMGGYGEIYQKKDSAVITEKPYVVKLMGKDSLYLSAKKIVVYQRPDSAQEKKSVIKAYPQARIYKSDIQGRGDSLSFNETQGIMHLHGKPTLWAQEKQITGDTIRVYLDIKSDKIDSINTLGNAFFASKVDSLGLKDEFNQVKGKFMSSIFEDGKIKKALVKGNAQSITYVDEEGAGVSERIGVSLSTCGEIIIDFNDGKAQFVTCNASARNDLYPMSHMAPASRFFEDFNWNTSDRLRRWTDIFLDTPEYPKLRYISDDSSYEEMQKRIKSKEEEEGKKKKRRPRRGLPDQGKD